MDNQLIIKELSGLIKYGKGLNRVSLTHSNRKYFQISAKNLIRVRFGVESPYYKDFMNTYKYKPAERAILYSENNYYFALIQLQIGVLESILHALKNGLTDDLFYHRELLVFSSLLNQAFEFWDYGLNLAASVYGRVVLETTIKEFAEKNNIDTDNQKFDQIIINLRKDGKIHKPFENSLRANYEIGTWAAHGDKKFNDLSDSQVKEFLTFIRDKILVLD